MKKTSRAVVALALALAACGLTACTSSSPSTDGTPASPLDTPPAAARTVFFDDFTGADLDRSKWTVVQTGKGFQTVNNEQQTYVDSADNLRIVHGGDAGNGDLLIQPRYKPGTLAADGRMYDFTSGRVDTSKSFTFTYGTFSARMKLPAAGPGVWPAFWALGLTQWPATGEIDAMENIGDPTWISGALHGTGYSGDKAITARRFNMDVTAWHVYTVDWTRERIVFYVDGRSYFQVTRAQVDARGPWAFDTPKYLILNLALGGQYPQSQNKIQQPYPGLAQRTVTSVQSGKSDVVVDWVRVTKP